MNTTISVAPAGVDDAEAMSHLMRSIIEPLPYYNAIAKQTEIAKYSPEALREAIEEESQLILAAKADDAVIGFCIGAFDSGTIWLSWYGVSSAWQGHGVGKMLLESLIATTRHLGIHKIWCDCRTENQHSRDILQKAGFQEICTIENHWYGQDFVLLQMFL